MTREELIVECKKRHLRGDDAESAIAFLRSSGCSKIETIAVIARSYDIDLGKSKELVHFSKFWSDVRSRDEEFHDAAERALSQSQNTNKS